MFPTIMMAAKTKSAKEYPKIDIVNIVATSSTGKNMDLHRISETIPDTEYFPEQFPGMFFRGRSARAAVLLFKTGNMVCAGSKSEKEAKTTIGRVVTELKKHGFPAKKGSVNIQNIVASVDLGRSVRMEEAARTLPRSMYEPEQFPGIIHRMVDPNATLLIFAVGKMVCAGTRNETDLHRAVHSIEKTLEEKKLLSSEAKPT